MCEEPDVVRLMVKSLKLQRSMHRMRNDEIDKLYKMIDLKKQEIDAFKFVETSNEDLLA